MKLDKALELNKESEQSLRKHKFIDHADAVKLGNEALIFYQTHKSRVIPPYDVLLPGEDA